MTLFDSAIANYRRGLWTLPMLEKLSQRGLLTEEEIHKICACEYNDTIVEDQKSAFASTINSNDMNA